MSMGGPAYQALTHRSTHGTAATFRGGAARGCAAALNAEANALIAGLHCAANVRNRRLVSDAEHMEKAFLFGGKPAAGAVMAATLIHAGWSGVPDIFLVRTISSRRFAPRENGRHERRPLAHSPINSANASRLPATKHQKMDGRFAYSSSAGCPRRLFQAAQIFCGRCQQSRSPHCHR